MDQIPCSYAVMMKHVAFLSAQQGNIASNFCECGKLYSDWKLIHATEAIFTKTNNIANANGTYKRDCPSWPESNCLVANQLKLLHFLLSATRSQQTKRSKFVTQSNRDPCILLETHLFLFLGVKLTWYQIDTQSLTSSLKRIRLPREEINHFNSLFLKIF